MTGGVKFFHEAINHGGGKIMFKKSIFCLATLLTLIGSPQLFSVQYQPPYRVPPAENMLCEGEQELRGYRKNDC